MTFTCSIMLREESSQPTFILARCSRLRGFNKLKNTRMRVIEGDNEEYECEDGQEKDVDENYDV